MFIMDSDISQEAFNNLNGISLTCERLCSGAMEELYEQRIFDIELRKIQKRDVSHLLKKLPKLKRKVIAATRMFNQLFYITFLFQLLKHAVAVIKSS